MKRTLTLDQPLVVVVALMLEVLEREIKINIDLMFVTNARQAQ